MLWRAAAALLVFSSALLRAQDSKICATCHASIASTYAKIGMGRSFAAVTSGETVADFYHAPSDTHYAMYVRDGRYYQRRWIVGYKGREEAVREWPVDSEIGSGNHGRTFLTRNKDNTLAELPLGWYAENGGTWGMNPGFDVPHPPQNRLVADECMSCHTSRTQAIGCERCHGPGAGHAVLPQKSNIVNPARLSPERRLEVCLQCHLETTSKQLPSLVRLPNREPFSYVPGQPLAEYVLSFDHAAGTGYEDKFEVAGAGYRFLKSRCFLESKGQLTCTTCHNPHDIARGEQAIAQYSAVCKDCHGGAHAAAPKSECISCHMQKRQTDDTPHISMTDHWIRANPLRSPPPASEYTGPVVPFYPAMVPDTREAKLAVAIASGGAQRLDAYRKLAERSPECRRCWLDLGKALREAGRLDEAADALTRAEAWLELAWVEQARQRPAAAQALFRRAAQQTPDLADLQNALGDFREAVRLDPNYAPAQANLARRLAETGQLDEAAYHYGRAAMLQPDWAGNLFDYAVTLVRLNRLDDAQKQAEAALKADPNLAEAHELEGGLLVRKGQAAAALFHFESAVKLKPGFSQAQLDLGLVLAATGRKNEAISHLQEAAKAAEPQVRQVAAKILSDLAASGK